MCVCVRGDTEVNQGAIEICDAFLAHGEEEGREPKYDASLVERLREGLREFLKACAQALELNRSIIDASQMDFQLSMQAGFQELQAKMNVYLHKDPTKRQRPTTSTTTATTTEAISSSPPDRSEASSSSSAPEMPCASNSGAVVPTEVTAHQQQSTDHAEIGSENRQQDVVCWAGRDDGSGEKEDPNSAVGDQEACASGVGGGCSGDEASGACKSETRPQHATTDNAVNGSSHAAPAPPSI